MTLQKGRQVTPFRMSSGVEFRFVVDKIGVLASSSVLPLSNKIEFFGAAANNHVPNYVFLFGRTFCNTRPTGATGWMYLEVVDRFCGFLFSAMASTL